MVGVQHSGHVRKWCVLIQEAYLCSSPCGRATSQQNPWQTADLPGGSQWAAEILGFHFCRPAFEDTQAIQI